MSAPLTVLDDAELEATPDAELEAQDDEGVFDEALARLRSYEQAALNRLMIFGEVTEGSPSPSPSQGDWALFCLLAKGGIRDPEQLERIARTSELAQSAEVWHDGKLASTDKRRAVKWARRNYLEPMIRKALVATEREWKKRAYQADEEERATPSVPPILRSLADFLRDPDALKPPAAVITRTAWAGRITMIASPEGWGKSTYVKAGCAAVTTGEPFLGDVGGPPGAVLWARVEESEYDLMANAQRFGADPERFVAWTPGTEPLAELVAAIRARAWAVIVVDSIHEFALRCGVEKLDDAAQVGAVLGPLASATRETGAAMIWTGQANKATGSYRNSSAFGHTPDVVFEIAEPAPDSPERQLRKKKSRFDLRGFTVALVGNAYQLVTGAPGTEDLGPPISKERRRILGALTPAMAWAEWLAAYAGNKDTFSSGVRWLRAQEYVRQDEERGTWSPNQFTVEQARAA